MISLTIRRVPAANFLRRLPLAYLIIWVLSPPLAYGTGWRILAALAMLLWLAVDTLSPRSVLLRPSLPVLGCVLFVVYTVFIRWLVPDGTTINTQFQLWILFFFLLVGESFRRGNEGDARFCFWLILCVLPVWMLATLWGVQSIAGDAARTVVRSSDEARELMEQGVGGYTLVYGAVLCLPFLTYLAMRWRPAPDGTRAHWRPRVKRALIWVNFVLAILLVIRAGYTIALVLSALGVLSVLALGARSLLSLSLSLFLVGFLALFANLAFQPILNYLESAATGTEYSAKLRDVRTSVAEGEGTGTVVERTERYAQSLRQFVENPVVGTLNFYDTGKHSAILDRFAEYGLAFGLLFMLLLIHVPFRFLRSTRVPVGLAVGFLVVAVAFPFVNNVFMIWGLMLYVFSRGAFVAMGFPLGQERRQPSMSHDMRGTWT